MRIALIAPGFSQDAEEWAIPVLQSTALALSDEHDVEVFSLRYPPAGRYQVGPLHVWATGGGRSFGSASLAIIAKTVRGVISRHRLRPFDVIHAFWADEPGLTAALAGMLLRRPSLATLAGGELVYLADAGYGSYGSAPRRLLTRLALAMATGVTAASDYQSALAIQRGISEQKLTRVNLGVDTRRFRPGAAPELSRPVLMQAASLVPVKDQWLLLEVLALVMQALPDARLILAGDGPLRGKLEASAQEQGLGGHVIWLGRCAYPDMPDTYTQAHLYVHTSRHESGPMAVLEAMACGLPVIGTPVGLLPEVACMPATFDALQLAEQCVTVLNNGEGYRAKRRDARERIEREYSLEQSVASMDSLYERLCREAGR